MEQLAEEAAEERRPSALFGLQGGRGRLEPSHRLLWKERDPNGHVEDHEADEGPQRGVTRLLLLAIEAHQAEQDGECGQHDRGLLAPEREQAHPQHPHGSRALRPEEHEERRQHEGVGESVGAFADPPHARRGHGVGDEGQGAQKRRPAGKTQAAQENEEQERRQSVQGHVRAMEREGTGSVDRVVHRVRDARYRPVLFAEIPRGLPTRRRWRRFRKASTASPTDGRRRRSRSGR